MSGHGDWRDMHVEKFALQPAASKLHLSLNSRNKLEVKYSCKSNDIDPDETGSLTSLECDGQDKYY